MNPVARIVAGLLLVGGVFTATACVDYPIDPRVRGQVVDKDVKHRGKYDRKYELDIVDSGGVEHEIRVSRTVYNKCFKGSQFPACTRR